MLITSEPKNNIYRSLIDLAFDLCDEFILVLHKEYRIFDSAKSIIEKLKPYLIEMKEQSTWAGTQLYEDTACVYHYRTSTRAREIIKEVSSALFQWIQPNFPEDLSFYKNGKPWLINIAHERLCYIINTNEKEIDIISSIKGLETMDSDYSFDENANV